MAAGALQQMVTADEDAPLTQLASAQVSLANAQSKEAIYSLTTLSEQYGPSIALLNSTAAARIISGDHSGAMSNLSDALSLSGELAAPSPSLPDTYINMLSCLASTDAVKAQALLGKFSTEYPTHPYVKQMAMLDGAFDRVGAKFAV